jgi:hypothetical protein
MTDQILDSALPLMPMSGRAHQGYAGHPQMPTNACRRQAREKAETCERMISAMPSQATPPCSRANTRLSAIHLLYVRRHDHDGQLSSLEIGRQLWVVSWTRHQGVARVSLWSAFGP